MGEIWDLIGSKLASILFIWAMVQKFCPYQVHEFIKKISNKLASLFDPYVEVRFFEYIGDFRKTNEAFSVIEHYLTSKSTNQSKKLQGEFVKNSLVLKIDESEEFHDEFEGIKVVWSLKKIDPDAKSVSFRPPKTKRYYILMVHRRHRDFLTKSYLDHVLEQGTGKSSLVAAIANFLKYDIYDIELTNVKTNAELRKLLIGITSKSVVVIEDIDCSLDLTGQRKTDSDNGKEKEEKKEENQVVASLDELKSEAAAENNKISQVANEDVETSLERLIQALRSSKEVAEKKEGTSGEDTSKKEAEDAEDKELDEEIDNRKS
ncbi:hypothetical protein P8452_05471 [Trifolium repens]|nr:hypothetical protein P8452_05471 [Trifolium repens]